MWIFAPCGFYSIVQKKGDQRLTVRARNRQHLTDLKDRYLKSMGNIRYTPDADYPYRATATRKAVAHAMMRITQDIRYENFKDQASNPAGGFHGFQGPRAHAVLHRVWGAVTELEPPTIQRRRWQGFVGDMDRAPRERLLPLLPLTQESPYDGIVRRQRGRWS